MALETPNRMAASILFFYAETDAIEPGSEDVQTITAIDGITALEFPPESIGGEPPGGGFYLVLQEPVSSDEGIWFGQGFNIDSPTQSLTPFAVDPDTGEDWYDDRAATNGNWLAVSPFEQDATIGFIGIGIFKLPRTDEAIPTLPITPVIPPP